MQRLEVSGAVRHICMSSGVKGLKINVKKAYNRMKSGEHHLEEMKRLSKQLLAVKKRHKGLFLISFKQCS
jgi:hypothetical protein